jgi:hypothetical protein
VDAKLGACPSCGLTAELFASYEGDDNQDNKDLEGAWQGVKDNWSSDDAHEGFMRRVAIAGDYRAAAARYRATESDPDRAERSRKMLNRIQTMATAALLTSSPKSARKKQAIKGPLVLVLVFLLIAAAGGVYFLFVKARKSQSQNKTYYDSPVRTPNSPVKPRSVQPAPRKPGQGNH